MTINCQTAQNSESLVSFISSSLGYILSSYKSESNSC